MENWKSAPETPTPLMVLKMSEAMDDGPEAVYKAAFSFAPIKPGQDPRYESLRAMDEPVDIMAIEKRMPEAYRDYYDPTNIDVKNIVELIKSQTVTTEGGDLRDLSEFLLDVGNKMVQDPCIFTPYKQAGYLRALGVLVYYDAI